MVKASELRIGNHIDGGIVKEILYLKPPDDFYMIQTDKFLDHEEEFHPIGLSPEILQEWCGFKMEDKWTGVIVLSENEDGKKMLRLDKSEDASFFVDFHEIPLNEERAIVNLGKITWLHQLQNLYFSLTSDELPILITQTVL